MSSKASGQNIESFAFDANLGLELLLLFTKKPTKIALTGYFSRLPGGSVWTKFEQN